MNEILNGLEKFLHANKDYLKSQNEWCFSFSFTYIFSNNFTDEEISRALITAAPKNIDIGDGTSIAIVYMQPWEEIHLIRVSNTTKAMIIDSIIDNVRVLQQSNIFEIYTCRKI